MPGAGCHYNTQRPIRWCWNPLTSGTAHRTIFKLIWLHISIFFQMMPASRRTSTLACWRMSPSETSSNQRMYAYSVHCGRSKLSWAEFAVSAMENRTTWPCHFSMPSNATVMVVKIRCWCYIKFYMKSRSCLIKCKCWTCTIPQHCVLNNSWLNATWNLFWHWWAGKIFCQIKFVYIGWGMCTCVCCSTHTNSFWGAPCQPGDATTLGSFFARRVVLFANHIELKGATLVSRRGGQWEGPGQPKWLLMCVSAPALVISVWSS